MTEKKIQHSRELTHSMAHYLLTIHKLREAHGYARVTDIANDLNLTKGSVSTAINNLKKKDFVVEDEKKFLSLSKKGHDEVHAILTSRTLLYYFFRDFLKVPDDIAHQDSCLMEHLLSEESRDKFFLFMKKMMSSGSKGLDIESTLDLERYQSIDDFLQDQKGDTYLKV